MILWSALLKKWQAEQRARAGASASGSDDDGDGGSGGGGDDDDGDDDEDLIRQTKGSKISCKMGSKWDSRPGPNEQQPTASISDLSL